MSNLKCITSSVDGNKYCVRERLKLEMAADLLAKVTQKMKKLVGFMQKTYPTYENVQRLVKNFNPQTIIENDPESEHTAYSENKGEKIAFCLNTTKTGDTLIDENTLTFVAIHELGHLMTKSVGLPLDRHDSKPPSRYPAILANPTRANRTTVSFFFGLAGTVSVDALIVNA